MRAHAACARMYVRVCPLTPRSRRAVTCTYTPLHHAPTPTHTHTPAPASQAPAPPAAPRLPGLQPPAPPPPPPPLLPPPGLSDDDVASLVEKAPPGAQQQQQQGASGGAGGAAGGAVLPSGDALARRKLGVLNFLEGGRGRLGCAAR